MPADRSAIRSEFAALLTNEFVGEGKLVKVVFKYLVADFGGQSPCWVLGSGGTERVPMTFEGGRANYVLDLFSFVLYAGMDPETDNLAKDAAGQPIWSEEDSEDALDLIEQQFGEFIYQRHIQKGRSWRSIEYAGTSSIDVVMVGGEPYRREYIPLRFKTF